MLSGVADAPAGPKFHKPTWAYDSAMLKIPDLFGKVHSTARVCLWRLHCYVFDCTHLLAMGVAGTPDPEFI